MSCELASRFVVCLFVALLPALASSQELLPPSLADIARKLRKDTTDEVRMTDADTKKLFESVDKIFAFAAEDTGMPKHATVKRRLVSKADVETIRRGKRSPKRNSPNASHRKS